MKDREKEILLEKYKACQIIKEQRKRIKKLNKELQLLQEEKNSQVLKRKK